jgi:hypothetical protein
MLKRRLKSVMFVHVYKKLVQKVTLTLQMHSIISFHVKMLIVVYLCCSEDSPLYCICRTPHDPERFYVGCEDCRYVHDNTKSLFKDSLCLLIINFCSILVNGSMVIVLVLRKVILIKITLMVVLHSIACCCILHPPPT